jgi:simple sugar transport system ATP-binding protein
VTAASATPLLELRGIVKRYGALVANDGVGLTVAPGEIHAVLGENGAGKSTLMKIVYGVTAPDAGEMLWRGRPVSPRSPAEARALGLGMVFQHFSLFETMTVAENAALALGGRPADLAPRIRALAARLDLRVDPDAPVHALSVGERQRVEILRCLMQDPALVIMDEPTSVLSPAAVPLLFGTLRRLAAEGRAILFISHKLEEIRALCHRATVMRGGRVVATMDPRETDAAELARLMIGGAPQAPARRAAAPADGEGLVVDGLSLAAEDPFGVALRDVTLRVRPGEVLGVAGVSGNGQAELARALSGERRLPADEAPRIRLGGRAVGALGPAERRRLGLGFVPEERLGRGAAPGMDLTMNALLTGADQGLGRRGLIRFQALRAFTRGVISDNDVRGGGERALASRLSGGNLQKFIMGREMRFAPKALVVAQPTWGVDVGAAAAIRQRLVDLARAGAAVLLISEELDELVETADRLQVMFRGLLSAPVPADAGRERIGLAMTGDFAALEAAHA